MRRWELVGGGSSKFWEAAVEGVNVTVRYGRIGTEGRTQARELASAEAAEAHFAKLVAEKEQKGYTEAAAAASPSGPEPVDQDGPEAGLPDEDTFVMPSSWRRLVLPRRGGALRTVAAPAADAAARLQERTDGELAWIEQVFSSSEAHPTLVRAGRAFLAGEADPLGAAVVPCVITQHGAEDALAVQCVDGWTALHGLPFAARAVVAAFDVNCGWRGYGQRHLPPLLLRGETDRFSTHIVLPLADRLRALLATADEEAYREAVLALEECRTTPRRRAVAAYLAPGTPGWMDACLADEPGYGAAGVDLRLLLLSALDDPAQLDRLGPAPQLGWRAWTTGLIATLADGVGTACAGLLDVAVDRAGDADHRRSLITAVTRFPTDEAFRLLLDRLDDKLVRPAVQEAMLRYPRRATRLLAETVLKDGKNAPAARQLLNTHVMLHSAHLPELLQQLDAAEAELVRSLDGARERVAEAAPEALPPLLVTPPWTRKRAPAKARVLAGLEPDSTSTVTWREGERERWSVLDYAAGWRYPPQSTDWAQEAAQRLGPSGSLWQAAILLHQGPVDVLAPWVEQWRPEELWGGSDWLPAVVAKYESAAVTMAVWVAERQPANLGRLLMPVLDVRAARVMASALVRLKSMQVTARSWFARHGIAAGLLMVPDAVGRAGAPRRAAEQALRTVAAEQGAETVLAAVAARYGDEAAQIVAAALSADPLENALPARMPELPAWVQPAVLPQILLHSGEALPEAAVFHVLTMLALSKPGEPYAGLAVVTDSCRADSLAAFVWALFEEWRQAAMPAKESWVLHAQGTLGDDGTVRRLTPILRDWPGQGAHHRAVEGLDVLAGIGTDVALLHLHGIAQRVKFKALKVRAQEKIAEVAEGLGLTGDQLSDRLVPDLGLESDGTTVIDYGPRRFTVGFDEQLRPFVLDADGKRRKDLPAPGVKDDQELAPAERKRFMGLKKDVRTIASDQIRRLEAAMVAQRTWTAGEFRELFVRHPLVWHLVRRLVWLADAAEGGAPTAFRVAEDRGFADVNDDEFVLAEDATVRLAHPLHLGDALAPWSELFAGYEILQPFNQLGRAVRHLTPKEANANRLERFEGCTVPVGRLLGLTKRGWERGEPQDAGVERWFSKKLADGCYLVIELSMGIAVGMVNEFPDQTFETVWLAASPGDHMPRWDYTHLFGDLDPIAASELLADLEAVTAP
ncbi:DUF4132 domain-containing protein [Streptacidiphilus pinicola]|uniref:DUF4132 domain-containing protein n=1 Tax=Streptacidiphilus pinicola TaxID=2219663 RepID=A0A2X0IRG6_9ACTN|nr:DUF4132 domain-containing protein [Streptacidiphilus pinicola]RAG85811.1 DUF4132 domain-containing protein [Streptacidiphilus pinicola]